MKNKKRERSFLGSVIYFFRSIFDRIRDMRLLERLKYRQRNLAGYDEVSPTESAQNAYLFGVAKVSFIVLFIAVTLAILLFGGRIFSYDNVYYMFKDIEYISSFSEGRPEVLNF